MTKRAYLFWTDSSQTEAVVAGLSVFLRQLLCLQELGIEEISLVGKEHLPRDSRLKLRLVPPEELPERAAICLRADLVFASNTPKRLLADNHDGLQGVTDKEHGIYLVPPEQLPSICERGDEGLGELQSRLHCEVLTKPHFLRLAKEADTLSLLLHSLIKPVDGVISRNLNRYCSLAVTRRLVSTSITPNQMTLFAALFGIISIFFMAKSHFVLGALFFQIQSILDGCDGEIARLRFLRSRSGEWLDNVCDDVLNAGFLVATGYGLSEQLARTWPWHLATLALSSLLFYHVTIYLALLSAPGRSGNPFIFRWWFQKKASGAYIEAEHTANSLKRLVALLSDGIQAASRRDFFIFFYFVTCLLGFPVVGFVWHFICGFVAGITTLLQWVIAGKPTVET